MYFYPIIRSIGWDTNFTVTFLLHFVRLWISQLGLYRSAWNFALQFGHISDRSSPILGDSPKDVQVMGINRGHMAGYAFCWSTCFLLHLPNAGPGSWRMGPVSFLAVCHGGPVNKAFVLLWLVLLELLSSYLCLSWTLHTYWLTHGFCLARQSFCTCRQFIPVLGIILQRENSKDCGSRFFITWQVPLLTHR